MSLPDPTAIIFRGSSLDAPAIVRLFAPFWPGNSLSFLHWMGKCGRPKAHFFPVRGLALPAQAEIQLEWLFIGYWVWATPVYTDDYW